MSSLLLLGAGTDKAASGYTNSETTAWVNGVVATGGSVTATEGGYVDTLVSALKSAESISALSQRFDRIWLFVTADNVSQQPMVDLVTGNSANNWVFHGTGTFAGQWTKTGGFTGNGTDNYLATGYIPGSGNYTQNSGHVLAYILNNRTTNSNYVEISCQDASHVTYMQPLTTAFFGELNGTGFESVANTTAQGLWLMNRTGSTGYDIVRNGAAVTGSPVTSTSATGLSTNPFTIGAYNGGVSNWSADNIGIISLGGGITNESGTSTAFNNYMISAGSTYHY